eukprot:TRINITY_DN38188_c0_g1_i1.p1 TRINITY_DN38188_c0_g1~~TRINITY_DN38188_c0_g1_i1.p1  ORF type:complete len:255 (-),score=48.13 TRINITY_DN38188_c0_g1_i1:53-817(-)
MAYFLTREEPERPRGGKRCAYGDTGSNGGVPGHPGSPLSRLVQEGYGHGKPPNQAGRAGFDAGIADQWQNNVQHSLISHQQDHDPNFVKLAPKTHGFRVSQAAGGQSSLSLAWDCADAEPARRGRGAGMERPPAQPSGFVDGNVPHGGQEPGTFGSRASSRQSGMSGCLAGASYGDAAYGRQAPGGGGHGFAAAAPSAFGGPVESGVSFGGRVAHTSSNAYACGSNQNVGNGITDRRTTRVLQPPGGGSQFSLG